MPNDNQEEREKLLKLVRDAVENDKVLRDKYQVGDKFRFIRDRLNALLTRIEEHLAMLEKEKEQKESHIAEDETVVYVYLFNAQGLAFPSWQKMLNPSVFYEHSVNRPIYTDKSHIDAFIRSKSTPAQHGYITMIVKKQDILSDTGAKDAIGNIIVKVKEGSLNYKKVVSFTHVDSDYIVNEAGALVKKPVNE